MLSNIMTVMASVKNAPIDDQRRQHDGRFALSHLLCLQNDRSKSKLYGKRKHTTEEHRGEMLYTHLLACVSEGAMCFLQNGMISQYMHAWRPSLVSEMNDG